MKPHDFISWLEHQLKQVSSSDDAPEKALDAERLSSILISGDLFKIKREGKLRLFTERPAGEHDDKAN